MGFDHHNLNLGLGFSVAKKPSSITSATTATTTTTAANFEPSLTLTLSNNSTSTDHKIDINQGLNNNNNNSNSSTINVVHDVTGLYGRQASPQSAVSSFSGGRVKRERDVMSSEEIDIDHDEDGSNARKKLRLTKEQSALLEESFKQHSTLNPKQKQALARQLNLRARQVEVWFQNRRARTKLKQTEVDCEFLKKCCETLTDENRRLQKEVQELKALKLAPPLYMHMPAATLTMCPSCERIGAGVSPGDLVSGGGAPGGGGGGGGPKTVPFSNLAHHAKQHFYSPFTNPSAAC